MEPFPRTGSKYLISPRGFPVWSPDGKELFVNFAPDYRFVTVKTQPSFTFSVPARVPIRINTVNAATAARNFDILPDGQRFIGVIPAETGESGAPANPQIQVVLNWFEDLKQRVPLPYVP